MTLVTRADGSTQGTVYDAGGNVTQQVDGLNHATVYGYDALNRKTSMADPLNRTTSYAYDLAGNLTSLTDPEGHVTAYSYDSANQLTAVAYQLAQPGNVSYGYDAAGRRTSMADGSGSTTYQYDSLGRLTSSTNGAGAKVGYGYDRSSRLTSIVYPGTTGTVTRTYDSAGRLGSVRDWLSHTTSFKYDADSNWVEQDYANSAVGCRTYDAADRLTGIINTLGPNPLCLAGLPTQFLGLSYSRDNIGQLATDSGKTYGYDPTNRLSTAATASTTTYGYDNADRITSMAISGGGNTSSLAYDNGDQLQILTVSNGPTQVSQNTYAFDGRGNRTSVAIQGGATTTLAYDQANHLTAYGSSATYTYNGDGLRMSKTVSGSAELFTWDLAEGLPLILQDGSTSYVTGPGGLPLEQINGTTVYYYHSDQLGSTRAMTDSAGSVQQSYDYDPYGQALTASGTLSNSFRYGGQYLDAESVLYYLRARYYDPGTGQFLTRDPMVSLTKAAYLYVADTPLNGTDPTGMDWWSGPAAAVVGGIGAFVGNAVDNLHSSNPALVALGVAESVVIAAPVAGVIFVAGGGAAVAAGLDALGTGASATVAGMPVVAGALPKLADLAAGSGLMRTPSPAAQSTTAPGMWTQLMAAISTASSNTPRVG